VSAVDDVSEGRRRASLEEVLRNIRAAAMTPAERDGLYRRGSPGACFALGSSRT
jgi:hypothetical protein